MTNSRSKGKRGELEFSKALQSMGVEARRGQQFSGGGDSPDVVTSLEGVHFEVKRVESLNLKSAMEQAKNDAGDKIPIVAHRKNRGDWQLTLHLSDIEGFIRSWMGSQSAILAAFETEPVSPRIQAKTDAILSSGGTISAESGKPMEIVQAAQDSVNEKLNGGESNE